MASYPSGTVAFLFTDIEGSTQRWEASPQAMGSAVARHAAILHDAITTHDGVLFKTIGDATQAAFPTVHNAISAAIAGQNALAREEWAPLAPLRVRMAIHVGEATPRDGDYLAPSLNRLARLLAAGSGEQILLTSAARGLASPLPDGIGLRELGKQRLRDLLDVEHVYQLTGPGLRSDFPPLKTLDALPNNLPAQPTPIIGRDQELRALREMLVAPESRLITLTGPGGTGKTRLAAQAAADVLDHFPDGVWWVPLAAVRDPNLLRPTIASTLGVRETPGVPLETTLAEHIRSRKALLVLDNFEQVISAAPCILPLLDAAPGIVILATSREPLRLRYEREFTVAPLPLPAKAAPLSADEALAYPAVRLFVDRAQAVRPGFTLDDSNVADVVAICQRLDGLPLAIELAAARIRLLTPAALVARLDRRLALLTGGARDLPERQQTLRATIAWSYELLDPAERILFARFAVFAGGFTFEAAESVSRGVEKSRSRDEGTEDGRRKTEVSPGATIRPPSPVPRPATLDTLDGIDSLVQKSLLRQEEGPAGESRFTMLETIREFAVEQLQALPEAEVLRRAHADTFLTLAESADWDAYAAQADLLNRLEADHANLRQAIAFYEQQGAPGLLQRVRLVGALAYFWWLRGHFAEGRALLDRAIAEQGDIPVAERVAAISGAAMLAEAQGDLQRAQDLQEETLALHQKSGDLEGIAGALTGLGTIARLRGDMETARRRHQEALDGWRRAGDPAGAAGALLDLGLLRQLGGDYAGAEAQLQESLELFRRLGDRVGEAYALNHLGLLAMSTGNLPLAINRFSESLRFWRGVSNRQMIATDLHNLGEAHHLSGALDEAERLYREALALFDEMGDLRGRGFALCHLGLLTLDRNDPDGAWELLRESLRLRWSGGLRGLESDTLDTLAETSRQLGDLELAAAILQASTRLRAETGVARQPIYEQRFQQVFQAVGALAPQAAPHNSDELIAGLADGRIVPRKSTARRTPAAPASPVTTGTA